MNKIIYNILNKIESLGYEAYVVGGYVRDLLLNRVSYDIDIASSATIDSLISLFPESKVYNEYFCIKFKEEEFNISITSYRKEFKYLNNKPSKVEYIDSLYEDSLRRDFTINSIYMNKAGDFIDPQNGIKDLKNHIIKMIGDPIKRLEEDANRILRALRFMSSLNFDLEAGLKKIILNNKSMINNINYERRKEELNLIFKDKNHVNFLKFIKDNEISYYLDLNYHKVIMCDNYLGVWAQIYYGEKYTFSSEESSKINSIKEIIKSGKTTNFDLYNYGLEISLIASQILQINKAEIRNTYQNLVIKKDEEIDIKYSQIKDLVSSGRAAHLYQKIKEEILEGRLENKYNKIKEYISSEG